MAARRTCGSSCASARSRSRTSSSRSGCVDAMAPRRMQPSASGSWPGALLAEQRARRVDVARGELADGVRRRRGDALVLVPDERGEAPQIVRVADRPQRLRPRPPGRRATGPRGLGAAPRAPSADVGALERRDQGERGDAHVRAWSSADASSGPTAAGRRGAARDRPARPRRRRASASTSAGTSPMSPQEPEHEQRPAARARVLGVERAARATALPRRSTPSARRARPRAASASSGPTRRGRRAPRGPRARWSATSRRSRGRARGPRRARGSPAAAAMA